MYIFCDKQKVFDGCNEAMLKWQRENPEEAKILAEEIGRKVAESIDRQILDEIPLL